MWQPTAAQWRLIWIAAICLILAWPADNGSLAIKAVNWAADPFRVLPPAPSPLALGLGDDMEAVLQHDAEETLYYNLYNSSRLARLRFRMRALEDPLDPSTERQMLTGIAIVCALGIWRLQAARKEERS
jgi:hypothetical protein